MIRLRISQIAFVLFFLCIVAVTNSHSRPGKDALKFISIDIQPNIVAPNQTVKVSVIYELKGIDSDAIKVTERKTLSYKGDQVALLEKNRVRRKNGQWIIETKFLVPALAELGEYEILQVVFSNYFSRSIKGKFTVYEEHQAVEKRLQEAIAYTEQLKNETDRELQGDDKQPSRQLAGTMVDTDSGTTGVQEDDSLSQPKLILPKEGKKKKMDLAESSERISQDDSESLEQPDTVSQPEVSAGMEATPDVEIDGKKQKNQEVAGTLNPQTQASESDVVEPPSQSRQLEPPKETLEKTETTADTSPDQNKEDDSQLAEAVEEKTDNIQAQSTQTGIQVAEAEVESSAAIEEESDNVQAQSTLAENQVAEAEVESSAAVEEETDKSQAESTQTENQVAEAEAESPAAVEEETNNVQAQSTQTENQVTEQETERSTAALPETADQQVADSSENQQVLADQKQEELNEKTVTDLNIQPVTIDDRVISQLEENEQTQESNMRLLQDAHEEIRLTGSDGATESQEMSQPPDEPDQRTAHETNAGEGEQEKSQDEQPKEITTLQVAQIDQENEAVEEIASSQPKVVQSIKPKAVPEDKIVATVEKQPIQQQPDPVKRKREVQLNQVIKYEQATPLPGPGDEGEDNEVLLVQNQGKIDPKVSSQAKREKFSKDDYGPWMMAFPLGSFSMGGERYNEKPVHNVNIEEEFSMMVHEVTIGMYQQYRKSVYGENVELPEPLAGNLPVTNISWREAVSFAIWLSEKSGSTYRLPTEAEWEYVAKRCASQQGSDVPLIFQDQTGTGGNQDDQERAVTVYNSSHDQCELYGLKGNVWEWTQDCWSDRYVEDHNTQEAYSYPKCGNRVVRGGSYMEGEARQTSTIRMGIDQKSRVPYIGFRLVRTGVL